jgi:DUF1680 family protein
MNLIFNELDLRDFSLTNGYWFERLQVNAGQALYHQYNKLEETGCLLNFRLAAGTAEGFREGFFFADSDAYKWLEAAVLSLASKPDSQLQLLVDDFISVIEAAQEQDGYLYTYNQIHFSGSRWQNLQVEHELYCLGHLIEAGVTHFTETGSDRLLLVARKAADLLVSEFMDGGSELTDGHEEIEIALLRLHEATGEQSYLKLAGRLLERRGHVEHYGRLILPQLFRTLRRMQARDSQRKQYLASHPDYQAVKLPPRNAYHQPRWILPRLTASLLSGRFTQNHLPVMQQEEPVGHAVRFVYLQTARAMRARLEEDQAALSQMETLWERMIERRMYVTGGLGALPLIEGFGNDYELPAEGAYAETCAALGSIFWNHELARQTGKACYDDLLEWQLYNAASVGVGQDGCSYLYNNPLTNHGEIQRADWYDCPCCPSNLSRTWSSLGRYSLSWFEETIRIGQYLSANIKVPLAEPLEIEMVSNLPWRGNQHLTIHTARPQYLYLQMRLPSWASGFSLKVNGEPATGEIMAGEESTATACGWDPRKAAWLKILREWKDGDELDLDLGLDVSLYKQDERIPGCGGMAAVGYGPLLYCLERTDSEDRDLNIQLDPDSIRPEFLPELLGGINTLRAKTTEGGEVTLIPYLLWGNRGLSAMTLFFKI